MPNLIEFVDSLCVSGNNILLTSEDIKAYSPFAINRALAQSIDTIMFAAEANKRPNMSKEVHYAFLMSSVRKKKRYSKWAKKLEEENKEVIEMISSYYQFSIEKARNALKCLTAEQIEQMINISNTGGTPKNAKQKK